MLVKARQRTRGGGKTLKPEGFAKQTTRENVLHKNRSCETSFAVVASSAEVLLEAMLLLAPVIRTHPGGWWPATTSHINAATNLHRQMGDCLHLVAHNQW